MFAGGWLGLAWAGAISRLCPHEASQVLRSEAESGRESWRAADLLQPEPVSLADSVIVTESDRQALLSRLTCDPGSECLEIWKNCEERQAVAPPAAWPSVIPSLASSPPWRNCCKNYYILWRASFFLGNICHAYDYRKLIFTVSKLFVISWWLILVNSDRK